MNRYVIAFVILSNVWGSVSALACGFFPDEFNSTVISTPRPATLAFSLPMSSVLIDSPAEKPSDEPQLPLRCVRGPSPIGGAAIYIYNDVAKYFLTGQYPTPGWRGGWGKENLNDCENHLSVQSSFLRDAGLNPKTAPVACAPTRQFGYLCYSNHVPVVLKTNQPLLDPQIYTTSYGEDTGEPTEYAQCVKQIAPLFNSKKTCISALKKEKMVHVLVGLDLGTSKVTHLGEFDTESACLTQAQ